MPDIAGNAYDETRMMFKLIGGAVLTAAVIYLRYRSISVLERERRPRDSR